MPPKRRSARAIAHARLEHLEIVQRGQAGHLADYRSMLAEAGTPYRRGCGKTAGRIMPALGVVAPAETERSPAFAGLLRSG